MSDKTTHDEQDLTGTPAPDADADTASGGAPAEPEKTDANGQPLENPSGG